MKRICRSSILLRLFAVLSACGLFMIPTALAQEDEKEIFTLEEVVVTAERRESNVQDTPVAVSAWDNDEIETQAIEGIVDLQMRMVSTTFRSDRIYIRGVGREMNQLGTDPGVGLFFDGFYNSEQGGLADLFDVERIESIRGPQSTLYGRATLGGAINVLYVRPTREWSGLVKARFGNYESRAFWAAFGGPIIRDKLMGRLVLSSKYYGGHQKNIVYDDYQGNSDEWSGAVKLLYEPTDNLSFYLKYGKSEYDGRPAQGYQLDPYETSDENFWFADLYAASIYAPGSFYKNPTWDDPDDGVAAVVNASLTDPWDISTNSLPLRYLDANQVDLTTTLDLGSITFKHLMFYRDWDYYSLMDWDYGPVVETSREGEVLMDIYEWSQELQFIYGGKDSPLSFIGGLYYYQEHRNQDFNLYYLGDGYWESLYSWDGTNILTNTPFDPFPPLPGGLNYYTPQANRTIYWYKSGIDDDSRSIYGQLDYQLTDNLNISLGARYSIDQKKGWDLRFYQWYPDLAVFGLPNDNFAINTAAGGQFYYHSFPMQLWHGYPFDNNSPPLPPSTPGHNGDWDAFLFKGGVDYRIKEDTLVYTTINRGYKPGGFVLGTIQGLTFDAEYITAYELGWKQLWLNDRYRTNITVYFYDYEDKQVADREGNETRVWNAATAENYGFEFEGTGYILENLLASLTYSYMNTEYTNFVTNDQADLLKGNQQLAGNPLNNSPEHKFAISGKYILPTDIGDFEIFAIYYWQDEAYYRPFATWRERAKAWDRVDARIIWNSTDYKWRASLFGKNVFDQSGIFDIVVGGPYENFWRIAGDWNAGAIPPRQFGIELSYRW